MPRRQFQVGPSRFHTKEILGQWWVCEHFWIMRKDGQQEDDNEQHGPFADEAAANTAMAVLEEQRK